MNEKFRTVVQNWLIPPVPYSHARRLYRSVKRLSAPGMMLATLAKNGNLRNAYAGNRCFVIGNGPSLNCQDLNVLRNEVTVACNWFYKGTHKNWHPTIYCAADPASSELAPEHYENVFNLLKASAYVFEFSVLQKLHNLHNEIPSLEKVLGHLYGVVFDDPLYKLSGPVKVDMTSPIPGVGHTPMLSVMVALYLGCNPIILIGLDHDYESKYFRGNYTVSHFYCENEQDIEIIPVLPRVMMAEEVFQTYSSYDMLNKIAIKMGVEIYDATDRGHLDNFPKIEYASLF